MIYQTYQALADTRKPLQMLAEVTAGLIQEPSVGLGEEA